MVFSSLLFLYVFLPVFLLLYYVTPLKYRNLPALVASYIFYAWGEPVFVFVLLASSIIDYILGKLLGRAERIGARQTLLTLSIIANVGLLIVFKYAGFLTTQVNYVLSALHVGTLSVPKLVLPLGISFFTFQKLSYIIDVYRRNVKPASTFTGYALYVSLFPQLIAGPIVRYHDVDQQLRHREHSTEKFCRGLFRFAVGLGKKVLVANYVAIICETIFRYSNHATVWNAWLATISFAVQIYFDFSGYSDMAIGLGRMMGFEFLENFNRPHTARNFSEFWKRWHISLCNWMFEYLYIPLGGSRKGLFRTYFNLWVIFLVSGFWHGASWNYVIWGAFHGAMLFIEKLIGYDRLKRIPHVLSCAIFTYLYLISTVLFNITSVRRIGDFLLKMHFLAPAPKPFRNLYWCELVSNRALACLVIGIVIALYPEGLWLKHKQQWADRSPCFRFSMAFVFTALLLVLSTMALVSNGYNPFIYFQF